MQMEVPFCSILGQAFPLKAGLGSKSFLLPFLNFYSVLPSLGLSIKILLNIDSHLGNHEGN